ncbi:hypothetical protein AB0F44_24330 [Nocardioides sp. NPDC023903]|uniref:hypothetical protein n=1 Tax=Nocardioides sp. NPDC023903 TaxID=3157195 RepID=UPI0033C07174
MGEGTTAPYLESGSSGWAWAPSGTAVAGDELLVSALGEGSLYVLRVRHAGGRVQL